MSTVQDLLNNLQFRVDTDADLYHLVNMAIRRIASRLYWHKSNILRTEMSLSLYAEQSYTADTIAFNNANPDTITDTASQFVTELFKSGMFIKTDQAGNPGPFQIITVAEGTLTLVATDSLTAAMAGSSVTITSLADRVSLPSDFWGLCGDTKEDYPYIDGYQDTLQPLPNQRVALEAGTGSLPYYFRIKGRTIHLYPSTGSNITIKGDYFARPAAVTALTDTIPFYELFDEAICEVIAFLYEKGLSSQGENQALLDKMLNDTVDLVVPRYNAGAPTGHQGGIDWTSYM